MRLDFAMLMQRPHTSSPDGLQHPILRYAWGNKIPLTSYPGRSQSQHHPSSIQTPQGRHSQEVCWQACASTNTNGELCRGKLLGE